MFNEGKNDCPKTLLIILIVAFVAFMFGVQAGIHRGRELAERENGVQSLKFKVQSQEPLNLEQPALPVTIYAYAPVKRCTDSTPHLTASMKHVRPGIIALSRDLERDMGLRFGDKVHIYGLGTFEFQDRMNERHSRAVDIYMPTVKQCRAFGVRVGMMAKAEVRIQEPESSISERLLAQNGE